MKYWLLICFVFAACWSLAQPMASGRDEMHDGSAEPAWNQFGNKGRVEYYAVKRVSFNSPGMDFSPFPHKKGIVFVSSRSQKGFGQSTAEEFLSLFYTEEGEDGTFSTPQPLNKENVTPYHLGPTVFFENDKRKIVTRNSFYKQRKVKDGSTQTLELAESVLSPSGKWSELVTISFGYPEYSIGHPAITKDGNTLYFSSNMPGSVGGSDLFVSHLQNGKWSEPRNLGPKINTAGQELFPYIHNDSILFFSSTGRNGLGGLDIYSCNIRSSQLIVTHLGVPVNSEKDDFGISLDSRGTSGFFSSNRSDETADDIYYFEEIQQFARIQLYDSITGDYVREAKLILSNGVSDGAGTSDLLGSCEFRVSPLRKYRLAISHVSYNSVALELTPSEWPVNQQAHIKVSLSPSSVKIKGGKKSTLVRTIERKALTNTISFSSAPLDIDVDVESMRPSLDSSMATIADSVIARQVKVIVVENVNGLPSLFISRNDSIFDFTNMENSVLSNPALGFEISIPQGARRSHYESIMTEELGHHGYGISRFLLIRSFYFDSEKTLIRNDASAQLDKIIEVMVGYPATHVQLIFHSDSRGSEKFNLELSKRRAEEVSHYLQRAGIKKERILSSFVGESQLLNDCGDLSDCDDLLHQMNRTVEFKLILKNGNF